MSLPKPDELISDVKLHSTPAKDWMEIKPELRKGYYLSIVEPKYLEELDLNHMGKWQPYDEKWPLPDGWQEKVKEELQRRMRINRAFKLFMDICVRCGACADKCHFFLGTGDPKNMPVLRAELVRSVIKGEFSTFGKLFGRLAGARKLDEDVIKEWFYYFYQCTECRRCSVFCPYGIDTAEITMMMREILLELGIGTDWGIKPVHNSYYIGNHVGVPPQSFKENLEFLVWEFEEITGIKIDLDKYINRKGAEIMFVPLSGDYFAEPGIYTMLGYLVLFHYLDLDVTMSPFATEGGNFGFFNSLEMAKRLHSKIYDEAKRLKVKWIMGGECGHMWRVWHQYHNTFFGPIDFLEVPKSPITGTVFEHAKSNKIIHIVEFTADLIAHGKLKLDPSRNDHLVVTFHDSCNTSRGMGIFEEPRFILKHVCNNFVEMPENTIREKTFCCGSGSGLNAGENMEIRMRGGLPRANAVEYVHKEYGVNHLACICAIDRAALPTLLQYWVPGVEVGGLHELVANALVFEGERSRDVDLRRRPLKTPVKGVD
ncbi:MULTISPECIES: sulfate reduction electron transfer complex DsrMKJOP subunit DsrK [Thermodesulfobacterium]|jgi:Fe-S oxidoreductase|uniref:sulfate reduction electron transfer complex DsrMKJOP subunit DsrK n=1 Tax=Thermodesulfobacterium TaxID=1740 RepID=UPI00074903CA|nr:(Fe-S)-binding protein [Thermodesulfobacterium sp.]KUJ98027.1 MAG: DsrK protein [Thermodesulfobacterium sp. 37_54]KUK19310.1 MAG: DsrK protein [Thermodesulfobacterium commune]MBZ4682067.1 menaquinol oxidoreductase [Thermodesulfobacterium sp.]HBT04189.1 menaquinol oxidoreductase [Thermodesulfobacterium commune]HCP10687.1 menaquinol oxidoreductase [Thermodesulfobacterium commune]